MSLVIDSSNDSLESFLISSGLQLENGFVLGYHSNNCVRELEVTEALAWLDKCEAKNDLRVRPLAPYENIRFIIGILAKKQDIAMQKVFKSYVTSNETINPSLKKRLIEVLDARMDVIEIEVTHFNRVAANYNVPVRINLKEVSLIGSLLAPEYLEESIRSFEEWIDKMEEDYNGLTELVESVIEILKNDPCDQKMKDILKRKVPHYLEEIDIKLEKIKMYKDIVSKENDIPQLFKRRLVRAIEKGCELKEDIKTTSSRAALFVH